MKALLQYVLVVRVYYAIQRDSSLSERISSYDVTIQINPLQQYFHMILFEDKCSSNV